MPKSGILAITLLLGLSLLSVLPANAAPSPTYSTSSITASSVAEASLAGYQGVLVNYTSSFSANFTAFVFVDLYNQAGQSLFVNVATCAFSAAQEVPCFVPFYPSVPAGSYTATVFAASNASVPVSTTSTLSINL